MPTLTLTNVKAIYNRPHFLGITFTYVTQNVTDANNYVDAVIAGTSKTMNVPDARLGIIATELDLAGVLMNTVTITCTATITGKYNRTAFIATLTAQNVNNPGQFATDVENGTPRSFSGPPQIIATELDFDGVGWHT